MMDVQQSLLADCCAFFFVSSGKSIIFADGGLYNEKLEMRNYKLEMRNYKLEIRNEKYEETGKY